MSAARDQQRIRALERQLDLIANDAHAQHADWIHFHETAIRDPFDAEQQAQNYCRRVAELASERPQ